MTVIRTFMMVLAVIGLAAPVESYAKGASSGKSYSGGKHTGSHGGYYAGSSGSSHKGGTYTSQSGSGNYGKHKK